MTEKEQKHTPLPWLMHSNGTISTFNEGTWLLSNAASHIAQTFDKWNSDEEGDNGDKEVARANKLANAAYIVKSANAYPKLVDMVLTFKGMLEMPNFYPLLTESEKVLIKQAQALLTELGE